MHLDQEQYFLVKDYLSGSCHERNLFFCDESLQVLSGGNEWSWNCFVQLIKRFEQVESKYLKTVSNQINKVLATKFANNCYLALCEYDQRIELSNPLAMGVDCQSSIDAVRAIGIFMWHENEEENNPRFELWEDAPQWDEVTGFHYPMFQLRGYHQPLSKYLELCIEEYEGETIITDKYPVDIPFGYKIAGKACDGSWIVSHV